MRLDPALSQFLIASSVHGMIKLIPSAQVAQSAERTLGKGEVAGSSPVLGLNVCLFTQKDLLYSVSSKSYGGTERDG